MGNLTIDTNHYTGIKTGELSCSSVKLKSFNFWYLEFFISYPIKHPRISLKVTVRSTPY